MNLPSSPLLTKQGLAHVLGRSASFYEFPEKMKLPGVIGEATIKYSFDAKLQSQMENLFNQYRPDYGAFVAMDAITGRVLSVVSYSTRIPEDQAENLAFRGSFPSASVFKIVTAAAAMENNKLSPDSTILFNGANHTLYKHNILKEKVNRWTRQITLREAFACSINTVFGKVGAFSVGSDKLRQYADRFGFNHPIQADFTFDEGKAPIPDDAWGVAEAASGFTRENMMSPMQGALMAAAIVNDGMMMEPYLVQSVEDEGGKEVYSAKPQLAAQAVDQATAAQLRNLMDETVAKGTSRKTFHGFGRHDGDIEVGGKTGSLTGTEPRGKYDWFVAYADGRGHRLAFAALTIHEKYWKVKSSYLVRRAIEKYFEEQRD